MLIELGIVALFLAFAASIASVGLALWGALRDNDAATAAARNAMLVVFPLLTVVSGILIYAQVNGIYELEYVNSVSKDSQPLALKITALWGGQAGSLILWSWMMSLFSILVLWINWKNEYRLIPWVIVVTGITLAFFLLLSNFFENPFSRSWATPDGAVQYSVFSPPDGQLVYPYQTPQGQTFAAQKDTFLPNIPRAVYDGRGLSPLLRHPGMIIHPPMLYLGFVGFVIPFAFSIAALIRGDLGTSWIRATRRWSLIAWMFLSLGLILGGRWAYDVLGWGGYWGWDPVENSSLLPWLTGTAFLHSVMIQEKRGMLKGWNVIMIVITYLLMLFGTVATRTGLLSSVHSFSQSPLSIPMGLFLGGTLLSCVALFLWRGSQGMFESEHELESMFSRESLFLFNNWIFLATTAVVFWGTWSELITGMLHDAGIVPNVINLGREYYEMVTPWLFLALFILMGVAPLAAWRKASARRLGLSLRGPILLAVLTAVASVIVWGDVPVAVGIGITAFAGYATLQEIYKGVEARIRTHGENALLAFWRLIRRNRRRYGGYIIHLSIVIIGVGIIASSIFQEVTQQTLNPGESLDIGPYTVQYNQLVEAEAIDGRSMMVAEVSLFRGDNYIKSLRPRRDFFDADSSPMTIAGLHSTIENDVYVLLTFWEGNQTTLRVYLNPLINLVWWGGIVLVLGTIIAIYPQGQTQAATKRVPPLKTTKQAATAGD